MEIIDRKYTMVCDDTIIEFDFTGDTTDHLKNSCQTVNAFSQALIDRCHKFNEILLFFQWFIPKKRKHNI